MEDRCICCGETIPEGRQVCPACEKAEENIGGENGTKSRGYKDRQEVGAD